MIVFETESRMRNIHQDDIKSKDERSIHEANAAKNLSSGLRPFLSKDTCTPLELMLPANCTPETPFRVGISTAWRERRSFTITLPIHNIFSEHSISNTKFYRFVMDIYEWKEVSALKNYRNLQLFHPLWVQVYIGMQIEINVSITYG